MREKMQLLADVWQQPGSVTLEYGGEMLSAYDVELSPETGKPKAVGGARHFETSYVLPQLRLFALEEAGWLTALKDRGLRFPARREPSAAGGSRAAIRGSLVKTPAYPG